MSARGGRRRGSKGLECVVWCAVGWRGCRLTVEKYCI